MVKNNSTLNRIDSTKHVVMQQLNNRVKSARNAYVPKLPKDGWARTIRQALGMSGAQLAKRMGSTRNKISILERKEASGDITINQLKELANGLGADLVYCVVPKKDPDQLIEEQARKKASKMIRETHQNMYLELQQISNEAQEEQIQFLVDEIKRKRGKILWG